MSEAPVEAPKPKKYESYNAATYKTDEEKKEELMSGDQWEARAACRPPATGPDRGSEWGWVGKYPASLMSAISGKLEQHADPLPQDLTEGVDEDE